MNPYLNKTMDELLTMQKELQDNPKYKNPAYLKGNSSWIYTKPAMTKMSHIAWAITYLLKEGRKNGTM